MAFSLLKRRRIYTPGLGLVLKSLSRATGHGSHPFFQNHR
jgi:hypothetical protein